MKIKKLKSNKKVRKKERREQPSQKRNPPMITSAKSYTKKKEKGDRQNPRTNGKSKAIQTKSHKEAYTYTLTKRVANTVFHPVNIKGKGDAQCW